MDFKVHAQAVKREKKYLTEEIGEEFLKWGGKKIIISAPTGMGKTTFVAGKLLDYSRQRGKKLLIICNRRLLRQQYWFTLVKKFVTYIEIEKCVKIMTYQELEELMKRQVELKKIFAEYEMVVCDECHYFYADADFNGFGTYALLQEIVAACATKTMVFMTATAEEVAPLIIETIKNGLSRLSRTGRNTDIRSENEAVLEYNFMASSDYKRFHCVCVPDWETMCQLLAESSRKSVVFLNNKEKGNILAEQMVKTGKIGKTEIAVLNADNIDDDSEMIQNLAICNRLIPKILITTAVLDNGVSIHDSEVGNVVIETESKIEFLQMLGRVRAESVNDCKLYFVLRDYRVFLKRKNRYEAEMEALKRLTTYELRTNREFYLQTLWDDDKMAQFYRKVLVWMKFDSQLYQWPENETISLNRKTDFYVNEFAKRKIEDMFMIESLFYARALEDPLKVVYEEMTWMGKEPDELQVLESEYHKVRKQEFIEFLLSVEGYSVDEMKEFRKTLVKKYRKDFFDDILSKNGTISNDKLCEICQKYDLELLQTYDTKNRRNLYTIQPLKTAEEDKS